MGAREIRPYITVDLPSPQKRRDIYRADYGRLIYSLFCLLIAPVRYSGLSFIPPTQAPLRCSYRLFWVHHDTHDPSTRQRFNLRPFVHRLYNLQAPAPLSLKGGLQRRMTSHAGSLSIVCLGDRQIVTIPLINHPSLSLREEGHHHPVHPPHSKPRSFPIVQQASI